VPWLLAEYDLFLAPFKSPIRSPFVMFPVELDMLEFSPVLEIPLGFMILLPSFVHHLILLRPGKSKAHFAFRSEDSCI
jgi:hypothetical protein